MSGAVHTPGPLSLSSVEDGAIKHLVPVDGDKFSILTVVRESDRTFAAVYKDEDARRLVACWNACVQLTTEQIEQIDGLMPAKLAYQVMRRDRDVLLEALKASVALADRNRDEAEARGIQTIRPPAMQAVYDKCVAAIALATGSEA